MNSENKKRIWRILNALLTLALLVFAWKYLSTLLADIKTSEVTVYWWLVLGSSMLFVISYLLFSYNWLLSARLFQENVPRAQFLVFIASQPYKYLPTSLFVLSSRAILAKRLGLSIKKSSIAQALENASILSSNFVLFLLLIIATKSVIAAAVFFVVMVLLILSIYAKSSFIVSFKSRKLEINTKTAARMFASTFFAWVISGLAFVLLNKALAVEIDFLSIMAGNTIAFSLGMLAFFAPGGIGIRELVYDKFGVNGASIIYWRVIVFILDFILGIPAILAIRFISKKAPTKVI